MAGRGVSCRQIKLVLATCGNQIPVGSQQISHALLFQRTTTPHVWQLSLSLHAIYIRWHICSELARCKQECVTYISQSAGKKTWSAIYTNWSRQCFPISFFGWCRCATGKNKLLATCHINKGVERSRQKRRGSLYNCTALIKAWIKVVCGRASLDRGSFEDLIKRHNTITYFNNVFCLCASTNAEMENNSPFWIKIFFL